KKTVTIHFAKDTIGRVPANDGVFGKMDGHCFLLAHPLLGDHNGVCRWINAAYQPSDSLPPPFLALMGLLFRNAGFLHCDKGAPKNSFPVLGKLSAHQNAVSGE